MRLVWFKELLLSTYYYCCWWGWLISLFTVFVVFSFRSRLLRVPVLSPLYLFLLPVPVFLLSFAVRPFLFITVRRWLGLLVLLLLWLLSLRFCCCYCFHVLCSCCCFAVHLFVLLLVVAVKKNRKTIQIKNKKLKKRKKKIVTSGIKQRRQIWLGVSPGVDSEAVCFG